jgi:release factor glutamine methyltransferase
VTLREHVAAARARLIASGISSDEAAFDAELLARDALGWDRARWIAHLLDPAPDTFAAAYASRIGRRAGREPVAYIRGWQEFWGRDFVVGPGVLIPRPETELIVEEVLARCGDAHLRAIDIGTGSGCLAVTLALERPSWTVDATDVSPEALRIAHRNADRLAPGRVRFREGGFFAGIGGPFDVVVSNPPYVASAEIAKLQPEVRANEPRAALEGGGDGLRDLQTIVREAATRLAPGGWLLLECGVNQSEPVRRCIADTRGVEPVGIRNDLQGIPRVVLARATN